VDCPGRPAVTIAVSSHGCSVLQLSKPQLVLHEQDRLQACSSTGSTRCQCDAANAAARVGAKCMKSAATVQNSEKWSIGRITTTCYWIMQRAVKPFS